MEKYQIIVNKEQLRLIADCLEDISRFAAGQPELQNTVNTLLIEGDDYCEKRQEVEELLYRVKSIIYPKLPHNASYGYNGGHAQPKLSRILVGNTYQIYREIKYFLAIEEGQNNAYSSVTLPSGTLGSITINKYE